MPELYEITCPHCAKAYELPREKILRHAGSKIQCKTCTGVFLMPALPDVESAREKSTAPRETARQTTPREPAMAASGTSSSEQTPWPFAFTADDDDDVKDVEVESSDEFSPSSSDSHFANAALAEGLHGEGSIDDETIDVEHESIASRPTPQPRSRADRINAVSGKLPVDAPFQKQEIAAQKTMHNDRIERPATRPPTPVSRKTTSPTLSTAPPSIADPEVVDAMRADLRSIARWVRFAGWLFVLTLLAAITLVVLTYFGIVDWDAVRGFWESRPAAAQPRLR